MSITNKVLAYMLLKTLNKNSKYLLRVVRNDIKFIHTHFIDLFKKDDSFIARALLSFGDYRLKIGSIFRDNKYFFGQKGNWEVIFTTNTQTKEHLEVYNRFFNSLDRLESCIENKLKAYDGKNKDWVYYFLKYPIILSKYENLSNVIGWIREWEEDVSSIEKLQKHTQISNQRLNVFLLPIAKMFDDDLLKYQEIDENNLTFLKINDMQIYVRDSKVYVDEEAFELFGIKDAVKEVIEYLKK
jgi:hypothetical protein